MDYKVSDFITDRCKVMTKPHFNINFDFTKATTASLK